MSEAEHAKPDVPDIDIERFAWSRAKPVALLVGGVAGACVQVAVLLASIAPTSCDEKGSEGRHVVSEPAEPATGVRGAWEFDGTWWHPRTDVDLDDSALAALVELAAHEPVRRLSFYGYGTQPAVSGQGWAALGKLVDLEHLHLGAIGLSADAFEAVAHLPKLETLSLWQQPFTVAQLAPLGQAKRLSELDLVEMPALGDGDLPALPALRKLSLSGTRFGRPTLASLATRAPHLESLNLSCQSGGRDRDLASLRKLVHLKDLSLAFCDIRDADLRALRGLPSLRDVDVSGTRVRAKMTSRHLPGVSLYNHLGE